MSIEDYKKITTEEKITTVINVKSFKNLGYWIRDIKNKMSKYKIENIKIILTINYHE